MLATSVRYWIEQDWAAYTAADHANWRSLYSRMLPQWDRYANRHFLAGLARLNLTLDRIPRIEDVNHFLGASTGFAARPVSGYVPAFEFFDSLANREFPTTVTIRPVDQLDYLPEPDIFHDVAGHVPMHTDWRFAGTLVKFGACAHAAAARAAGIRNGAERAHALGSMLRAMARFFWFTIEFGLMRTGGGYKAYGSGLLSSYAELAHCIESRAVRRVPLRLEAVVNQPFQIDRFQPLLFHIESFDQLYAEVARLEDWLLNGRLDNVAGGEPAINEQDLESFLSSSALG